MEPKKTPRADLSRKSFLFFNIGLVTSLSLVILAFSYRTTDDTSQSNLSDGTRYVEEIVDVPVTQQQPPPPQLRQPQITEVANTKEIEQEININMDAEVTDQPEPAFTPLSVEAEPEEDLSTVFTVVEESASPVGGPSAFNEYLARTILYPRQARKLGVEGKVYVEFVVERDGTITNVKILKGIGAGCDEEAVRVINIAPKWNPGKQRGKPVRQKMVVPLNFRMS